MNDPGPSLEITLDIAVESDRWDCFPEAGALAETAIVAALRHADAEFLPGAEVSLLLCDDAFIRDLNARWRGQDKPTNVLSFPAAEDPATTPILGDIAIAFETLAREAEDEGKSLRAHYAHLLVHGTLHLVGYDHQNDAEAEEMESLERECLASLGIDDPYRLAVVDKAECP
ncbi:rRNA maturation RNase YbeY [Methylovirgula sp. HY1]|uniref:rRNA maturation RNase YbeY n=1 Tax=Methylovirgula sp. HY1 TaxID=2822761 RepID=UPI001C5B6DEC|nr:rRNA maturation RNase YbeY [Methylovirgula sp. HY1]QXX75926.1 Endoribonuclease YbeY [Methylovirgula sp. HY1]